MHNDVNNKCLADPFTLWVMSMSQDVEVVLAANLRALMDAHVHLRTQTAVAKATRGVVNQTTVSHILAAKHKPSIVTVAALASAFDLQPWQLLVPGLDPAAPPLIKDARGPEAEFYRRLQALASELGINGK